MKDGKKLRKKLDSPNRTKSKVFQTPLFQSDTLSDFPEFQDKTHPVPIGWESVLSDLQLGRIKAVTAMVFLVANYLSSWKSNKTHYLSINKFSECLGIVPSYAHKALTQCGRWLKKLKSNRSGTIYTVTKHDYEEDVPSDDREPKYLQIPYGFGSPMERMFKGHISWKSCLVWIMMKWHSCWRTGVTNPTNMPELARLCRMGSQTICRCIRELQEVGLLVRLSALNEAAIYQLLPKPKSKPGKAVEGKEYGEDWYGHKTANHVVSRNWQYRICLETGDFEKRVGYNEWRRTSDYERHNSVPKKIVEHLKAAYDAYFNTRQFRLQLESA